MKSNSPSFKLDVKIDKSFSHQTALMKQWPKRIEKIKPMMAYKSASYLLDFIKSKLKGSQHRAYRGSLEIVKVKGGPPSESSYAVQIDSRSRLVKEVGVKKNLLYVRLAPRAVSPSKKVQILQKYSPWTVETLPFKPDPREGIVITMPAKAKRVAQIAVLRARQRSQYMRELQKLGVRQSKSDRLKLPKGMDKLADVSLDALKLEFGLGGGKPHPGWKVGISRLRRIGFKSLLKDKKLLVSPLTKPSFNLWKKWPPKTAHTISRSQTGKFRDFQNKVGK